MTGKRASDQDFEREIWRGPPLVEVFNGRDALGRRRAAEERRLAPVSWSPRRWTEAWVGFLAGFAEAFS